MFNPNRFDCNDILIIVALFMQIVGLLFFSLTFINFLKARRIIKAKRDSDIAFDEFKRKFQDGKD